MRHPVRPSRVLALAASLAAFLAIPGLSTAQITTLEDVGSITDDVDDPYPRFVIGITGYGLIGSVAMTDLNEALDVMNLHYATNIIPVKWEHFSSVYGWGGGVRSIAASRILLEVTYERLTRDQSVGGVTAQNLIEIPADAYFFTVGYDFLGSSRDTRFGFSVGVGRFTSSAQQSMSETRAEGEEVLIGTVKLNGDAWGSQYAFFFEKDVTEKLFLSAQASYRIAKMKNLEYEFDLQSPAETDVGQDIAVPVVVCDDDGENCRLLGGGDSLDWTGFELRVGFTYYFNIPTAW